MKKKGKGNMNYNNCKYNEDEDVEYIDHTIMQVTNRLHIIRTYAPDMNKEERNENDFSENPEDTLIKSPRRNVYNRNS